MKHLNRTGLKAIWVLLVLALAAGIVPGLAMTARAEDAVHYIDHWWGGGVLSEAEKILDKSYSTVKSNTGEEYVKWKSGWYVVRDNVQVKCQIDISGIVNLILCDGAKLDVFRPITVNKGNTLNIYAQGEGTGALVANSGYFKRYAGIGCVKEGQCGTINIHGGHIEAIGGLYAAGIGGSWFGAGGEISIYGGEIIARGNTFGAGIGGGDGKSGGKVSIYGGKVTAKGGEAAAGIGGGRRVSNQPEYAGGPTSSGGPIYIYGGEVNATGGRNGAGIGGGQCDTGGITYIYGGTVNSTAGAGAAGIGAGLQADGNSVYISGGSITAKGGQSGAGIGGAYGLWKTGHGGAVTITDGTVLAIGGESGAGIGGGMHSNGGAVTISGGTVTANGGRQAAGIGGGSGIERNGNGGTLIVNGGTVTASGGESGAGIGGGYNGNGGKVTINGGTVIADAAHSSDNGMGIGHGYKGGDDEALSISSGMVLYGGSDRDLAAGICIADGSYTLDRYPYMRIDDRKLDSASISYDITEISKTIGKDEASFTNPLNNTGDGTARYVSSNESVATVDADGRVNITGDGEAIITATVPAITGTCHYQPNEASYTVKVAQGPVAYIECAWSGDAVEQSVKEIEDYTAVRRTAGSVNWSSGQYVASGSVTVNGRITVSGTVDLILSDGAALTAGQGIRVPSGAVLNIYGQSEGTGTLTALGNAYNAGIGGDNGSGGGTVIIHGGIVNASGGTGSAGIGGAYEGKGGTLIIYGGRVEAIAGSSGTGAAGGAGIGGGADGRGGDTTIYGGSVNAYGSGGGAGIGGGDNGAGGGTLTVYGGTVNAKGGAYVFMGRSLGGGAGIGGGRGNAGSDVLIYGGTVITGGAAKAAGIGAGNGSDNHGSLTVTEDMYVYGGSSDHPDTPVVPENGEYARERYMIVNHSKPESAHTHSFTYTAGGDTITAECTAEGCTLPEGKAKLTIVAPALAVFGADESAEATVTGDVDVLEVPAVFYYAADENGEKTGDALEGAPAGAGMYRAEITLGTDENSATAYVTYTIAKAESTSAIVIPNNRTYDGTAQPLVIVDESTLSGGVMMYALGTDAENVPKEGWSTEIPTALDAGTYYVWYKVAGDANHTDTQPRV